MWEFSGNPVYFCCYDYFAANDPTSIHVIVFSLEEPYEIQLNQVIFWLSFLKSLVPVEEPIGEPRCRGVDGPSSWPCFPLTPRSDSLWPASHPYSSFLSGDFHSGSFLRLSCWFCSARSCFMTAYFCHKDSVLNNSLSHFSLSFCISELWSFLLGAKWDTLSDSCCAFT